MYDRITYHRTLKPYEVSGRGSKVRQQKGSGKARWGLLRGSGKKKPGKSWGHIPTMYTHLLPVKVKLKSIQSLLSAKLAEGKVIIYDREEIQRRDPVMLKQSLPSTDNGHKYLFVHTKNVSEKFDKLLECVKDYKGVNANQVSVKDMVEYDKIIFTKDSLREFTELFLAYLYYWHKPKIESNAVVDQILNFSVQQRQPDEGEMTFDAEKGFEPKFQVLQDYY